MSQFPQKTVFGLTLLILVALLYFLPKNTAKNTEVELRSGLVAKSEAATDAASVSELKAEVEERILESEVSKAVPTAPSLPVVAEAASKLRRGINNRLLLPEAVVAERRKNPNARSPEVIFSLRNAEVSGPLSVDEHTLSVVEASVDITALESFLSSNDGAIRLPIAEGKEVLATINRVVSRGPHTTTVIGQVQDDSFSDILLVFHDGSVNGSVSFHDTNTHYQFAMAGNGDVAIRHLDVDSFLHDCGNCENPEHLASELAAIANEQVTVEESEGEVLSAPAGAIPFDSVIGYSAEARISDGGTANIEGRIIASVDNLNLALSNSQSGGYFCSLLAMLEEPDQTFSDSNYETMGQILTDLNQTTDGVLDALTDLRDELGADQATFVCNAGIAGVGGVANRPGRHSVCGRNQMFSPNLVFAHEVGHNLGLRHGWGDSGNSGTNPKDQSNYGWRFDPPNGGKVRTIMSYGAGWGGSRIKYFSNPNVNYNGAPTGAPRGFDATDTSGTPAYDQKFVLNGDIGGLGAGFDGSNPNLGARNGDYLVYNSNVLVIKDVRESLAVLEPVAGAQLSHGETTTVFWHGGDHTDTVQIDLYKDGVFHSTIASGIDAHDRWYDWTVPSGLNDVGFTIRVTLSGSTTDDSGSFTIGTPIVTVPYTESFENGLGAWSQSTADNFDWTRNSGGTITGGTGPEGASSGDWYVYIEPHDNYDGHNKIAQIDCVFDMSNVSAAELSFDYHMYGVNIDYLAVDVYDGTTWATDVWKVSGAQHTSNADPWLSAAVDLSAYAGNAEVTIRFRAKQNYWHVSDIAIDKVVVDGPQFLPIAAGFEDGLRGLRQSTDDDLDWTLNTGETETVNTGPSSASEGTFYMYVENHDRSSVYYKTASLEGTFDFSTIAKPELRFDYHMYGPYIDYLAVDVYDGAAWVSDVWKRTNAQHSSSGDPWLVAVVDLSAYAGNGAVTIRFRSKQKKWNAADTAIDNLQITDAVGPLVAHWSMDDNAGTNAMDITGHGYDATSSDAPWVAGVEGTALDFDGISSTVTLPSTAFATIDDEITISMWVYGDTDQPQGDSAFYAVNTNGNRVLNVHLPWGDGNVYWDAGYDSNFDRIFKQALPDEYKGRWNHWVFTKNAVTEEMAIYLNGSQWHSGTGKTHSMSGITEATLGSQISGLSYSGMIDEVRLYNVSLDAAAVSALHSSYATTSGVPFGWLISKGIDPSDAGAQANADSDSQNNELEWFLGLDPLVADSPFSAMAINPSAMNVDYTRRKLSGVSILAEWSPDLSPGSWDTVGLSEVVSDDDGEIETITVTLPIGETDDKKFMRVRVE